MRFVCCPSARGGACSYAADGLYSDLFLMALQAVTNRQEYDPLASSDGAVRESKTRPGEFKLDRRREDRTIPEMAWACGGCRRLMQREVHKPKTCSKCNSVRYCGQGGATASYSHLGLSSISHPHLFSLISDVFFFWPLSTRK